VPRLGINLNKLDKFGNSFSIPGEIFIEMTNVHVTLKIKKDSFEIKPLVLDLPVFLS